MSKSLVIAPLLLVLGGCAAFNATYGFRVKGGLEPLVSLRRVTVHRGPTAYVGKLSCGFPIAIRVLEVSGVEKLAFLRNDRPLRGCGLEWASVMIPSGQVLGSAELGMVVSRSGYVVACVEGDSRPSEIVVETICP